MATIQIDLEKRCYLAGSCLKGEVLIEVKREVLNAKELMVRFVGGENTQLEFENASVVDHQTLINESRILIQDQSFTRGFHRIVSTISWCKIERATTHGN